MGNSLVGIAPSQIYPVEHYLHDIHDVTFDQSLGSTRFFKVVRAKTQEGLIVVKVFAILDPSLPLAVHRERLDYIRAQLATAVNCLSFQRVVLTDKAAFIMREYVKYSLYDRISTRPFLTNVEKKWITFQVLYSLYQCHKLGICHGDIKLENIMLTSWNWILLADFASFKPTFLPEDNPADYSYFFDTSRRRLCYVAPERFVKTLGLETGLHHQPKNQPGEDKLAGLFSESTCRSGELLPTMDIFSAGCAIIELWNDGTPPMDLPGLLTYKQSGTRPTGLSRASAPASGVSNPAPSLSNLEPRLAELLRSMTSLEPEERSSADVYLDNERGKLFPEYFYSFLQSYMLMFSAQPILPPDEKIARIHQDVSSIINMLTKSEAARDANSNTKDNEKEANRPKKDRPNRRVDYLNQAIINIISKNDIFDSNAKISSAAKPEKKTTPQAISPDSEGLIIIISLVTSCIRGLRHCTSKLMCLEVMLQLAEHSPSDVVLERILPYIIHLTHDASPRVRIAGLNSLAQCMAGVDRLPKSDWNVFPEYILPEIAARATDASAAVRAAYANNIPTLAETALRFLDQTQSIGSTKEAAKVNYETELSALHEMVRQTVSSLLTDSQALVRRTLVESGITKLCVFFGKQKAYDVIVSHVVTFLNGGGSSGIYGAGLGVVSPVDCTALRACFYDCIVGAAAATGRHAAGILMPLLQQGLTDPSEFIIAKALLAAASLAELGLLSKLALAEMVAESVCYLAHPNMWIRHEVVGLISTVATILNPIDVHCKILPLVWPHLKYKLTQVERPALVLESLQEPVPRSIFDCVMRYKDINQLIETLRERRAARQKVKQGMIPQYREMCQSLKNLFRRLMSDGLTDHMECQLLAMSAHLIKIQRTSSPGGLNQITTESPGKLSIAKSNGLSKMYVLDSGMPDLHNQLQYNQSPAIYNKALRGTIQEIPNAPPALRMNSEWRHMFGKSGDNFQHRANDNSSPSMNSMPQASSTPLTVTSANLLQQQSSPSYSYAGTEASSAQLSSVADHSLLQERSFVQYSMAPCRLELRNLTARQQMKYIRALRSRETSDHNHHAIIPPKNWRPGNTILAHLNDHKASVNKLATLTKSTHFASCSSDGTVRLWDAAKMEGLSIINRAKSIYNRAAGPVVGLAACDGGHSLAAVTQTGIIFILRTESNSSKMLAMQSLQLECEEMGSAVALAADPNSTLVTTLTLYGSIICWDLRQPGPAVQLQAHGTQAYSLSSGVPTSVWCGNSWLASSTSNGQITIWDLRFSLPITTIVHPNGERIRSLHGHPTQYSRLVSVSNKDISVWCCETKHRTHAFVPAGSTHYLSCAYPGVTHTGMFVVTGSSDQRVRYWNMDNGEDSQIVIGAANDATEISDVKYSQRLIEGTLVTQEHCSFNANPAPSNGNGDENAGFFSEGKCHNRQFDNHTAPITDVTLVDSGHNCYVVSASQDGIINVWK